MSDQQASRFTPQNKTTNERLSTHTVGLVALSDFRKRRAAVLEQQEREAREAALSGTSKPDRSLTGTPDNAGSDSAGSAGPGPLKKKLKKKAKQNPGKKLLSFGDDDDDGDNTENASAASEPPSDKDGPLSEKKSKFKANTAVGLAPKAVTKAALRKEAAERETLRREFVALQESIKETEFAIPFVFYDGANTPGGTVRMKKGDFIWVFLDKSRKVGAELGVGEQANAQRAWARVGVDDLMLVRGTVIIPHVSCLSSIRLFIYSFILIMYTNMLILLLALRLLLFRRQQEHRSSRPPPLRLQRRSTDPDSFNRLRCRRSGNSGVQGGSCQSSTVRYLHVGRFRRRPDLDKGGRS
jgi:protein FAM50